MPPLPPMEEEFADLVPLFVEESRERLEKLAVCRPRLAGDPQAAVQAAIEARRELHTLKGAGRMMRLGAFAELCHAAEELLHGLRPGAPATAGLIPLLMRVLDRLSDMVDVVRRGGADPAADAELVAVRAVGVPGGAGSGAAAPSRRRTPSWWRCWRWRCRVVPVAERRLVPRAPSPLRPSPMLPPLPPLPPLRPLLVLPPLPRPRH